MLEVLSFGAGVQSTTLLYMSCDGVLPKLDAAIFADTQWEPRAVYAHLERCKEKAAKAGIRVIVSTAGNLRQDLLDFWHKRESADGKRYASIPAFVKSPGKKEEFKALWGLEIQYGDETKGMVRRQCTGTYKIEVVESIIRTDILGLSRGQRWPTVPTVRQWIGISADEVQRRRKSQRPAIVFYYPLLETLTIKDGLFESGYTRGDCFTWLAENGYPEPPRSACIGCPFHSDAEWARLKAESPDEFADACEVDRLIRDYAEAGIATGMHLRGAPYLHSSLIPLEMVEFKTGSDKSEGRGMVNECQGMCGV